MYLFITRHFSKRPIIQAASPQTKEDILQMINSITSKLASRFPSTSSSSSSSPVPSNPSLSKSPTPNLATPFDFPLPSSSQGLDNTVTPIENVTSEWDALYEPKPILSTSTLESTPSIPSTSPPSSPFLSNLNFSKLKSNPTKSLFVEPSSSSMSESTAMTPVDPTFASNEEIETRPFDSFPMEETSLDSFETTTQHSTLDFSILNDLTSPNSSLSSSSSLTMPTSPFQPLPPSPPNRIQDWDHLIKTMQQALQLESNANENNDPMVSTFSNTPFHSTPSKFPMTSSSTSSSTSTSSSSFFQDAAMSMTLVTLPHERPDMTYVHSLLDRVQPNELWTSSDTLFALTHSMRQSCVSNYHLICYLNVLFERLPSLPLPLTLQALELAYRFKDVDIMLKLWQSYSRLSFSSFNSSSIASSVKKEWKVSKDTIHHSLLNLSFFHTLLESIWELKSDFSLLLYLLEDMHAWGVRPKGHFLNWLKLVYQSLPLDQSQRLLQVMQSLGWGPLLKHKKSAKGIKEMLRAHGL